MPIIIPKALPAYDILNAENIFVMSKKRAVEQDIRPVEIAIVNLMPTKIATETQLIRLLSNSLLQVNITLVKTGTYNSKHTAQEHLDKFYKNFDEIKDKNFDGMIVTGAPVETLDFEDIVYWDELKKIMDFADKHVTSTIYICWGALAAMHYFYGIDKVMLPQKMFGVYANNAKTEFDPLLKGMDDNFYIPMSRYTTMNEEQLANCPQLKVLAGGDFGSSIIKNHSGSQIFLLGHSEYDRETLRSEYLRDVEKGIDIQKPINYFIGEGVDNINVSWKSTANLLFYNWLNYYVYQVTPYQF